MEYRLRYFTRRANISVRTCSATVSVFSLDGYLILDYEASWYVNHFPMDGYFTRKFTSEIRPLCVKSQNNFFDINLSVL